MYHTATNDLQNRRVAVTGSL